MKWRRFRRNAAMTGLAAPTQETRDHLCFAWSAFAAGSFCRHARAALCAAEVHGVGRGRVDERANLRKPLLREPALAATATHSKAICFVLVQVAEQVAGIVGRTRHSR
jgi:hypothetical protein